MFKDILPEKEIAIRNKQLLRFFTRHGYNIRLVGDKQKPSVILNEIVVLSCYVKNFNLYFTKEPFSEEIVRVFKLTEDSDVSELEIQEAVEMGSHRQVYKLKLTDVDMYLVGFNFMNSELALDRYPVFGKHNPKVYFDREYAENLVVTLAQAGYQIKIE